MLRSTKQVLGSAWKVTKMVEIGIETNKNCSVRLHEEGGDGVSPPRVLRGGLDFREWVLHRAGVLGTRGGKICVRLFRRDTRGDACV